MYAIRSYYGQGHVLSKLLERHGRPLESIRQLYRMRRGPGRHANMTDPVGDEMPGRKFP